MAKSNQNKRIEISHIVAMGDSLSDRGTLESRKALGFLPMAKLAGLEGKAPAGSFTNGMTWIDHLGAKVANQFLVTWAKEKSIKEITQVIKKKNETLFDDKYISRLSADYADEQLLRRGRESLLDKKMNTTDPLLISELGDLFISNPNSNDHIYSLSNDKTIKYNGYDFIRTFCEGGLTAHDFRFHFTFHPLYMLLRMLLSRLDIMRNQLLSDDNKNEVSDTQKARTLIIEWSGANDLITVNRSPTKKNANRAIHSRIANAEILIRNGYRNIILFNLPDLSLTPRYQAKSNADNQNAKEVSLYFNAQLAKQVEGLQTKYPFCNIDIFDINREFNEIYNNPEKYTLDKEKLHMGYVESKDFKVDLERGVSGSSGYMFWDDVHPSADVHAGLAEQFSRIYQNIIHYVSPEMDNGPEYQILPEDLCKAFNHHSSIKITPSKSSMGLVPEENSKLSPSEDQLMQILRQAKVNKGVRKALVELQWLDKQGNIKLNIPALIRADQFLQEGVKNHTKVLADKVVSKHSIFKSNGSMSQPPASNMVASTTTPLIP